MTYARSLRISLLPKFLLLTTVWLRASTTRVMRFALLGKPWLRSKLRKALLLQSLQRRPRKQLLLIHLHLPHQRRLALLGAQSWVKPFLNQMKKYWQLPPSAVLQSDMVLISNKFLQPERREEWWKKTFLPLLRAVRSLKHLPKLLLELVLSRLVLPLQEIALLRWHHLPESSQRMKSRSLQGWRKPWPRQWLSLDLSPSLCSQMRSRLPSFSNWDRLWRNSTRIWQCCLSS